jgi:flagellar hook-length control protein FliK
LKVLSASENNKKENGKGENQHKQEKQNLPVEKEVSTPIRDAMMRADAAKVNSPIVLDGISIEANKFNDSSEITAVSPRFVKIFEKEIVEQVQRTILNSSNKNGIHEISLTLNPEKLGEIKLTIQVDGNIVSARMSVENLQVKQIIEQNMQNLKDSLAQHSLDTGSLDVNVGESDDYRELFERMSQARNRVNRKNKLEAAANETAAQDLTGVDTGRRFGTNSFELYA